ncbi:MAG: ribosome maturation factor RimP [Candidatus Omnitrophota bacterium]
MKSEQLIAELEKLIGEFLASHGMELVELVYRFEGQGIVLRVIADYPRGGISMGECSRINRAIGDMLEEKNAIDSRYILEVCSPGFDRPLRTARDFKRCASKTVKCFLKEPINGKIEWDGVIGDVSDARVVLQTQQGVLELPLEKINKAKQIIL